MTPQHRAVVANGEEAKAQQNPKQITCKLKQNTIQKEKKRSKEHQPNNTPRRLVLKKSKHSQQIIFKHFTSTQK